MPADECLPAQTIISPPVQTPVCRYCPTGAMMVRIATTKRFVARAVEKVTAFVELESAIGAAAAEIHTQRKT